jgi:hypothetical protein
MKALPTDIKFSMVKGSMNFGLDMFEGDGRHTNAEELGQLFAWLTVYNEDHPCSVFLNCMPEKIGMVKEAVAPFCNCGTRAAIWYKPYKFNKNPALGLDDDVEFRVIGWRTADGKLRPEFFELGERSRVAGFPVILKKLLNKDTGAGAAYNKAEENPVIRYPLPHP